MGWLVSEVFASRDCGWKNRSTSIYTTKAASSDHSNRPRSKKHSKIKHTIQSLQIIPVKELSRPHSLPDTPLGRQPTQPCTSLHASLPTNMI